MARLNQVADRPGGAQASAAPADIPSFLWAGSHTSRTMRAIADSFDEGTVVGKAARRRHTWGSCGRQNHAGGKGSAAALDYGIEAVQITRRVSWANPTEHAASCAITLCAAALRMTFPLASSEAGVVAPEARRVAASVTL